MSIFARAVCVLSLVFPQMVGAQEADPSAGLEITPLLPSDVQSNGAFNYAVAIDLPDFRGLVPDVSLVYSSSNRSHGYERNLVGAGWNLTGFSVIEKGTPGGGLPIFELGATRNIFTVDGEPLLACADATATNPWAGTYPDDWKTTDSSASCLAGGTHAALHEDYRKYVKSGSEWLVYDTDGTVYTYQNLAAHGAVLGNLSSSLPFPSDFLTDTRWLLSEISDASGANTVSIDYDIAVNIDGWATRPTTITYAGYTATFHYVERDDPITYATGTRFLGRQRYLLEAVTVEGDGPIRAYDLIHTQVAQTGSELLSTVREFGADYVLGTEIVSGSTQFDGSISGSSLAPVDFTYALGSLSLSVQTYTGENAHSYLVVSDFDNDGIDDIYSPAVIQRARDSLIVAYSLAESFLQFDITGALVSSSEPAIAPLLREDGNSNVAERHTLGMVTAPDPTTGHSLLLINRRNARCGCSQLFQGPPKPWDLELYDLFGSNLPLHTLNLETWNWGDVDNPISYNRDNFSELNINGIGVYRVDASGFTRIGHSLPYGTPDDDRFSLAGDLNGDGLSDYYVFKEQSSGSLNRYFAFGGDGEETPSFLVNKRYIGDGTVVGDVNGDGIVDYVTHDRQRRTLRVRLGTGFGIEQPIQPFDNPEFAAEFLWAEDIIALKTTNFGDARSMIVDINGDGLGDLILHNGFSTASLDWDVPPDPLNAHVFLSTGHSFVPAMDPTGSYQLSVNDFIGSGDFNGDGLADFISQGTTDLGISFASNGNPALMVAVETSRGETISIAYGTTSTNSSRDTIVTARTTPLSGGVVHGEDGSVVSQSAQMPLNGAPDEESYAAFSGVQQVVTWIERDNGRGQVRRYDFSYGSAYWIPGLRRFSGYEWVLTTLPSIDPAEPTLQVRTTYDVSSAGVGRVISSERFALLDDGNGGTTEVTLSEQITAWDDRGSNRPYRVTPTGSTSRSNVSGTLGGTMLESTSLTEVNDFGQVTLSVELGHTGAVNEPDRYTYTEYVPNLAAYIVDRPSERRVQDAADPAAPLQRERFRYDGAASYTTAPTNGWLTVLERWDGTADIVAATMTHDAYGNTLTETDALSNTTTHTYDSARHLFRVTSSNALSHSSSTVWNADCQQPTSSTDPNALVTSFTYDPFCREITQSHTSGNYRNTEYANFGTVDEPLLRDNQYIEVTMPAPSGGTMRTRTHFDGFGQVYRAQTPGATGVAADNIVTQTNYNERGQVASRSEPYTDNAFIVWTTISYDTQDRPVQTVDPLGNTTQVSYLIGADNTLAVRTQNALCFDTDLTSVCGESTSYTNGLGQTVAQGQTDFDGTDVGLSAGERLTTTTYDVLNRLVAVTDPIGAAFSYSYNPLGQRILAVDPDLGSWSFAYDLNGNLTTQTDARGTVLTFTYDALNRPYQTITNGVVQLKLTYDAPGWAQYNIGRQTASWRPGNIYVSHGYDATGTPSVLSARTPVADDRMVSEKYTTAPSGQRLTAAFRIADYGDWLAPFTTIATITYDQAGREATVTGYITSTTYNARGQVTYRAYANGSAVTYTYNELGWLMSVLVTDGNAATAFSATYTRDAVGRITNYSSNIAANNFDYTYDYAGRLLAATSTNGGQDYTYSYDAGGNMITNSAVGTYTYPLPTDPRPHTPTVVDGTTLAYDANGNMLTGLSGRTVVYDYANRPTSVSHAGQTTGFTYDGTGARQSKVVDGITTFYAGMAEIRNFGTPQEQLILQPHADFRLVDGVASYLHRDHLASVRAITDASGVLVERAAYSPYGVEDNDTTLTNPTPEEHGFIGERFDASTGLQYLNARYYDPDLGRFIQPDWWEVTREGVGTNRYAYSFNDPVNNSDPSGNRLLKFLFDPIGANIGIFVLNNYYGMNYEYGAMSPEDLRWRTPSTVVQSNADGGGNNDQNDKPENDDDPNGEPPDPNDPNGAILRAAGTVENADRLRRFLDGDLSEFTQQSASDVTVATGARGGTATEPTSVPNSYADLGNGHVVVYGDDGRRILDVSSERVKVSSWNPVPGEGLRMGRPVKTYEGSVPSALLDILGLQ